MAEEKSGFLSRLFGRKGGKGGAEGVPGGSLAAEQPVPVSEATVGLCFDYGRGVAFESEFISDEGLKHIVEVLGRYKLRGTFNCPAKLCESASEQIVMLVEAGHEIAIMGYNNESPRELTQDAIKQMLFACRNAFRQRGLNPIGFRSPQSHWSQELIDELAKQQFVYSAEHDHGKQPYVLVPGDSPLFRVPIYTNDRGLRHRQKTFDTTVSKHHRLLRRALTGSHFISVVFSPFLLQEEAHRMAHFEEWLETAVKSGLRLCAMEDVVPKAYRDRAPAAEDV